MAVVITDRDAVIASAGVSKKEYAERKVSYDMEKIMEKRSLYLHRAGGEEISVIDDGGSHFVSCAMPIVSEGDIIGAVCSVIAKGEESERKLSEDVETKLIQTAANFLSRQIET